MTDADGGEQSRVVFTDSNIVYYVEGVQKWVK